jgi:hypothetical protein
VREREREREEESDIDNQFYARIASDQNSMCFLHPGGNSGAKSLFI